MLFSALSDTGECIRAYVVPDSYSADASLDIYSGGQLLKTIAANGYEEHVRVRHRTGMVVFVIDGTLIDGLAGISDLELRDEETQVLVYRRTPAPVVQERLFRLETHLFPLWRFDHALKPHFAYWYDRIDRYTPETAGQISWLHHIGSVYSSGRLLYRGFDEYIYNRQKTAIMIHDPYEELAERLLMFNRLGADANQLLNGRDAMIFAPIVELAGKLERFDEREFRRVLNKVSPQTLSLLRDPLTRQLVCATPDEPPPLGAVSKSLKTLSEFSVVGIRRHWPLFSAAIAELLGLPEKPMPPILGIPRVREVANNLRSVRWIEGLLENDLEVYDAVEEAFAAAA